MNLESKIIYNLPDKEVAFLALNNQTFNQLIYVTVSYKIRSLRLTFEPEVKGYVNSALLDQDLIGVTDEIFITTSGKQMDLDFSYNWKYMGVAIEYH